MPRSTAATPERVRNLPTRSVKRVLAGTMKAKRSSIILASDASGPLVQTARRGVQEQIKELSLHERKDLALHRLTNDQGIPSFFYVLGPDSKPMELAKDVTVWNKFLLLSYRFSDKEKFTVIQTFWETFLDLYGRGVVTVTFHLGVPDGPDLPYLQAMVDLYDSRLRASALKRLGARAILAWGHRGVIGYPLSFQSEQEAGGRHNFPAVVMTFLVTGIFGITPPRPISPVPLSLPKDPADADESSSGAPRFPRLSV